MRMLRLIGPGDDDTSLILETVDGTEQFTLSIDERLRNVSSSDLPRLSTSHSENQAPSPREIQTRVRAGESAESVAEDAGISLERVMRFAYPVLQERLRVSDEARRARARRGSDGQLVEFGELLSARLATHGVDPAGVTWNSYRRDDGGWTVTAGFFAQDEDRLAKFSFVLTSRTVSALDALAADLLSDRPVQVLLAPPPPPVTEDDDAESTPVRLAAVPNAESDDDETEAEATPAIRPGRRLKARTRPIPVDVEDELFDQDAIDAPDQPWHEPPLPLDLGPDAEPEPPAEAEQPRRAKRGDKPRMPSWDDILLGVRHKD